MKINNKIAIALMLGLSLASCKKGWLDVNENPNSPGSSSPGLVFTNAVNVTTGSNNTAIGTGNTMAAMQLGSYWSGQWAQSSSYQVSAPLMQYVFTNSTWTFWTTWFDNLADYEYVINTAASAGEPAFKGYAKVMKAFTYQRLVDMYGDVPYTQALNASAFPRPVYDNQDAVYGKLIMLLDEAIADINAAAPTSSPQETIFGGNKTKWVRFANTVKMRILMRQSRITSKAAYITAEVNKVIASGGVLQEGDDAKHNPGFINGTAGKLNPFYNVFGFTENGQESTDLNRTKINSVFITQLKAWNDFRFSTIAAPIANTSGALASHYVGVPLGSSSAAYVSLLTSSLGECQVVKGVMNKPVYIISAAEAQLLMAEAKESFPAINTTTSAQTFYNKGVELSFLQQDAGFTLGDVSTYLGQAINNVNYAASTNKLNAIAWQKWIALANFDGIEAWAEQRKSGIPSDATVKTVNSGAPPTAPVRLPYPIVEVASNGANVPAGINAFTTRLFWDIN